MFRNNNTVEEKAAKTALLLGALNLVTAPLAILATNRSLGMLLTIAANVFVIYKLHELGKSRRSGSNMLNTVNTFVSSKLPGDSNIQSAEVDNSVRNIINGGAAITDELVNGLQHFSEQSSHSRPRR